MTHTATPWRINDEGALVSDAVGDFYGDPIVVFKPTKSDDRPSAENKQFIVRACNAHDDLVGSATTFSEIMEPFASLPPFEAMARFKELCASGGIDILFFELARAAKVSKAALDKATHE